MGFDLPDTWTQQPLENLCERVSVGHVGETSSFFTESDGIPFIRSQNVRPNRVDLSDIKFITKDFHAKSKKSQLHGGDLLIVRVGQNRGDCAVLPADLGAVNCANIVFARPDSRYSDFLGIYFNTPKGHDALLSVSSGSAQLVLNTKAIAKIQVPVPPASEAEAIGALGRVFENRINLLRETNATLEAIAQALFKSWFVDFDPVRAKMEGRAPEGMDEATAALFPDSLEETELGVVPRGWGTTRLDSFIELAYGKALKAETRRPGGVPVYGSGGITGWHDKALVDTPSVIVGRKGTVGSIYWESRPFFPIDTVFYVKTKHPLTYCHQLLKTLGLNEMNTDAAVPGLNRENVYRLLVPDAPPAVLASFDVTACVLRQRIDDNEAQAQTLSTLRDTLLTRMISGQLRLTEAKPMKGEMKLAVG
jgi:type I restriction enzyme S subunit